MYYKHYKLCSAFLLECLLFRWQFCSCFHFSPIFSSASRSIFCIQFLRHPLVMTHIDIEHGPFINGLPITKNVVFYSYVQLPEGTLPDRFLLFSGLPFRLNPSTHQTFQRWLPQLTVVEVQSCFPAIAIGIRH